MRLIALIMLVLATGCAPPSVESEVASVSSNLEVTSDGDVVRLDFDLPLSHGAVHSRLAFAPDAIPSHDRRMIALVPGTLANGAGYYDIATGTGYNAAEILANEGFFVLMVDLPGTAGSYHPADGRTLRAAQDEAAVMASAVLLAPVLGVWHGIDVYGETGLGSNVALLAARRHVVRSVSIASAFYMQMGPGLAPILDPGFHAFFDSIPGGYIPQDPAQIGPALMFAPPAIAAEALTALLGPAPQIVPMGVYYDLFDAAGPTTPTTLRLARPSVYAEPARAPALLLQGSPDFFGSEVGTAELAAAYGATGGGDATVVTIPGASHLMRFDAVISDGPSSPFWDELLSFLDDN